MNRPFYFVHHESDCAYIDEEGAESDGLSIEVGPVVEATQAEFESECRKMGMPPPYYQIDFRSYRAAPNTKRKHDNMQTAADPNIISISGRLSFPALFEAKSMDAGSKPKFSATFLMDKKKDAASIKKIQARIDALIAEKWKGKKPAGLKVSLHDGSEKEDKEGYGPDVMYINANSDKRPVVVDRDKTPLTSADNKPYAGCYVNGSIQIWVQDNQFGKRINASLRAVQFVKDGEPFGGGTPVDAESELPDVDDVPVEV